MSAVSLLIESYYEYLNKYSEYFGPARELMKKHLSNVEYFLDDASVKMSLKYSFFREYYNIFGFTNIPSMMQQEKYVNDLLKITAYRLLKIVHEAGEKRLNNIEAILDFGEKDVYDKMQDENDSLLIKMKNELDTSVENHRNEMEFRRLIKPIKDEAPLVFKTAYLMLDSFMKNDSNYRMKILSDALVLFSEKSAELKSVFKTFSEFYDKANNADTSFLNGASKRLADAAGINNIYM